MLVTLENLTEVLQAIKQNSIIAIDTETTGLRAYHGDQLFSIIVATKDEAYYFNFNEYPGIEPLPANLAGEISGVFNSPEITKIFHNAKFDLAMLKNFGISVAGPILDLWFLDRILDNQHFSYTLADVAKRHGREKSKEVDAYIKAHKLTKWVEVPHLNKKYQEKYFAQVPLELMQKYAENDARITFDVATEVLQTLKNYDDCAPINWEKMSQVVSNESRLTETLFRMEQTGVQVDLRYCEEARSYYERIIHSSAAEFKTLTGHDFVKGSTVFEEVFKDEAWKYTEIGNPIFDAKSMKSFKHPAAGIVRTYAEAKKQLEYFQNFIWFADKNGVVHGDLLPAGTKTGRFSSRDPNLQNLTNPDKYGDEENDSAKYPVRRAFVPREGFFFAALDYSQIEYRVMLDMAKANSLINLILQGHDVHSATSKLTGATRRHSKIVNFLTLYGGGVAKLATDLFEPRASLKQLQALWKKHLQKEYDFMQLTEKDEETLKTILPEVEEQSFPLLMKAKEIQDTIFKASPEIKDFIKLASGTAKKRGFIRNWFGRRYQFSNKNFCYKAPNHYVQGSCADILKVAMNRVDDLLKGCESRMILTIHDELIFEIRFGEEHLIPSIKKIMESVYPFKRLPLLVEVEYSFDNLADKHDWNLEEFMSVKKTRDQSQREGYPSPESPAELLACENPTSR